MKNQSLFDCTCRLTAEFDGQVRYEKKIIELIEDGQMRTSLGYTDTTAGTLETARKSLKLYQEGLELMRKTQLNLINGG